jgi:hypothetical protein
MYANFASHLTHHAITLVQNTHMCIHNTHTYTHASLMSSRTNRFSPGDRRDKLATTPRQRDQPLGAHSDHNYSNSAGTPRRVPLANNTDKSRSVNESGQISDSSHKALSHVSDTAPANSDKNRSATDPSNRPNASGTNSKPNNIVNGAWNGATESASKGVPGSSGADPNSQNAGATSGQNGSQGISNPLQAVKNHVAALGNDLVKMISGTPKNGTTGHLGTGPGQGQAKSVAADTPVK